MLGTIIGGIAKLGGALLGSSLFKSGASMAMEYGLGKMSSAQAYNETMKSYRNRYSMTVADMRRAGINPILAAQSISGGGVPQMSPWGTTGHMASGAQSYKEIDKKSAEIKRLGAQTLEVIQNTRTSKEQERVYLNQAENLIKQLQDITMSIEQKQKQIWMLDELLKKARNDGYVQETWHGMATALVGAWTGAIGKVFSGSAGYSILNK